MFGPILLLLIVVPVVELYVLSLVADSFGWGVSLASLLAISLIGGALVKWQSRGAFTRVVEKMRAGQMPSSELVDGGLMIFGGTLLLTPGFITDAVGLAMFVPPLRAVARGFVLARVNTKFATMITSNPSPFRPRNFKAGAPGQSPWGRGRPTQPRSDVIDVEEVIVERVEDPPSFGSSPTGSTND